MILNPDALKRIDDISPADLEEIRSLLPTFRTRKHRQEKPSDVPDSRTALNHSADLAKKILGLVGIYGAELSDNETVIVRQQIEAVWRKRERQGS